jgi:hypothetical protein
MMPNCSACGLLFDVQHQFHSQTMKIVLHPFHAKLQLRRTCEQKFTDDIGDSSSIRAAPVWPSYRSIRLTSHRLVRAPLQPSPSSCRGAARFPGCSSGPNIWFLGQSVRSSIPVTNNMSLPRVRISSRRWLDLCSQARYLVTVIPEMSADTKNSPQENHSEDDPSCAGPVRKDTSEDWNKRQTRRPWAKECVIKEPHGNWLKFQESKLPWASAGGNQGINGSFALLDGFSRTWRSTAANPVHLYIGGNESYDPLGFPAAIQMDRCCDVQTDR